MTSEAGNSSIDVIALDSGELCLLIFAPVGYVPRVQFPATPGGTVEVFRTIIAQHDLGLPHPDSPGRRVFLPAGRPAAASSRRRLRNPARPFIRPAPGS